jgi:hypothetical protein
MGGARLEAAFTVGARLAGESVFMDAARLEAAFTVGARLAGESVFMDAARLEAAFAGKPRSYRRGLRHGRCKARGRLRCGAAIRQASSYRWP